MSKGLFLGKFMPPHNGHLFVCDVALRYVDELTVLVCSHDAEPIDGNLRAAWMRECLNKFNCNIVHMHRDIPQEPKDHPDFWQIWKNTIFELHPEPLDFIFGSEEYVQKLAKVMEVKPFIVDLDRQIIPVSGTSIRDNPIISWDYIPPPVRSYLRKRVTLLGAESTGKSTLSKLLAEYFKTKAIPEYGRDYDALYKQGSNWGEEDFIMIAKGHFALAQAIEAHASSTVVEDTDLLQTVVWSEALLSEAPKNLVDLLHDTARPDLYLLLSPEMEWKDDGTRYHSSEEERKWFHSRLRHWLNVTGAEWEEISGSTWEYREQNAKSVISNAFSLG